MPESRKPLLPNHSSQTPFNMSKKMEHQKRKKVLVVGAGAAGKITYWVFMWICDTDKAEQA